MQENRVYKRATGLIVFTGALCVPSYAATDFPTAVEATHPVAYYRLDAPTGKSLAGASTYKSIGGVTGGSPSAPIGLPNAHSIQLNGTDGYVVSTQMGGVGEAASMMAWVNLADLPSKVGHFFYVEGESEVGNDLDVQFETDNVLKFYTAAGGNLSYAPPVASLVGQWHWIVVTLNTATHTRVIYWDGKQVATDKGGGRAGKTRAFSIGASTVFSGRFFKGQIQEAALWSRSLTAAEVSAIYATAKPTGGASAGAASAAGGATTSPGPSTNAKVEVSDTKNVPIPLKQPEKVAFMFISALQQIEEECWRAGNHVCTIEEAVAGPTVKGQHIAGLKFDPKTDPDYTFALTSGDSGWDLNVNAAKPGLMGFCLDSHNFMINTVHYNRSGKATPTDAAFGNTGIEGDSFRTQ